MSNVKSYSRKLKTNSIHYKEPELNLREVESFAHTITTGTKWKFKEIVPIKDQIMISLYGPDLDYSEELSEEVYPEFIEKIAKKSKEHYPNRFNGVRYQEKGFYSVFLRKN